MYDQERKLIIDTCRYLQSLEYFLGTWGNVSMRVGDQILLTPSKVNYDTMVPEDIVVISMDGTKISGERNPTSEKEVHRRIYLVKPEVRAVIHAHTKYAMAVSTSILAEVPCMVEEMSQLLGGSIPLTREYVPAGQHEALGQAAADAIGDRNAVILRNHGPVACGRNMDEALLAARVTEKACEIYMAAKGSIHAIPDEYAASEHYRYFHTYGKEKT